MSVAVTGRGVVTSLGEGAEEFFDALAAAERDGHLAPGSLVGMVAFGAGFVWAAGLTTWKDI